MATKDWKKLRGENMWANKSTRGLIGLVRNANKDHVVTVGRGNWDNNSRDIGKFKTKAQALKFARTYMRSH